jgi:hypothetical protein
MWRTTHSLTRDAQCGESCTVWRIIDDVRNAAQCETWCSMWQMMQNEKNTVQCEEMLPLQINRCSRAVKAAGEGLLTLILNTTDRDLLIYWGWSKEQCCNAEKAQTRLHHWNQEIFKYWDRQTWIQNVLTQMELKLTLCSPETLSLTEISNSVCWGTTIIITVNHRKFDSWPNDPSHYWYCITSIHPHKFIEIFTSPLP